MHTVSVLVGVALAAISLAPLIAGCASPSPCVEAELADYPGLEDVAANELTGVVGADELFRIGSCEDTGQPSAAVAADVSEWRTRRQARSFFLERGWSPTSGRLLSPDGRYNAYYILLTDDNVVLGIQVRFYMAL